MSARSMPACAHAPHALHAYDDLRWGGGGVLHPPCGLTCRIILSVPDLPQGQDPARNLTMAPLAAFQHGSVDVQAPLPGLPEPEGFTPSTPSHHAPSAPHAAAPSDCGARACADVSDGSPEGTPSGHGGLPWPRPGLDEWAPPPGQPRPQPVEAHVVMGEPDALALPLWGSGHQCPARPQSATAACGEALAPRAADAVGLWLAAGAGAGSRQEMERERERGPAFCLQEALACMWQAPHAAQHAVATAASDGCMSPAAAVHHQQAPPVPGLGAAGESEGMSCPAEPLSRTPSCPEPGSGRLGRARRSTQPLIDQLAMAIGLTTKPHVQVRPTALHATALFGHAGCCAAEAGLPPAFPVHGGTYAWLVAVVQDTDT